MSWWRRLLKRGEMERHLDAELRFHFDGLVADHVRAGMSEPEARRSARLEFGGVEQVKEECRDARGTRWIEDLWQDLHFALRTLRKTPGFAIVVISTLALGIGMNTAIFSVVNTVLLKPVHAPEPDRIVEFMNTNRGGSGPIAAEIEFNLWHEQTSVFQEVSGYSLTPMNLTGVDQPQRVEAISVTKDYFRLFGLAIAQGRGLTDEEERPAGTQLFEKGHVVVLSDAFWTRAFGGEPQMVGKVISLSGDPFQVVGIMAAGVQTETPEAPDVWLPLLISPNSDKQVHYFQAEGRLKPGVTLDMANAQLQLMTEEFRRKFPNTISTARGDAYSVQRMRDILVRDVRLSVLVLAGAVAFVLLIACANVANLLLVKAAGRRREIAMRIAVGAARGRVIRQLLTEGVLLSMAGAAFGLGLGVAGIHALLAVNPVNIPRIGVNGSHVSMDWRVFAFTMLAGLTTGLFFGLIPALQASRTDLNSNLKEGGGREGSGFRQNRTRSLLVISEISLALVLLIGAALLIRTLIALRSVNPGFETRNVVTTRAALDPRFTKAAGVHQLVQNALGRVTALPGVESAGLTGLLPLDNYHSSFPVIVIGRPLSGPSHGTSSYGRVSAGYFDTLKIPLLRGRFFTDADRLESPQVAIINQAMARQFWPDGDPLNSQILIAKGLGPRLEEPVRQIVGIVGDVHDDALNRNTLPAVFVPLAQLPDTITADTSVAWAVRVRAESPLLNSAIQNELRTATGVPVPPLRSMDEIVAKSTARQNFNMILMSIFGCAALLLSAIGIYGLMAYSVQQRTKEIGIRMALGAQPGTLRNMVLFQGARLALIGVAIGIGAALGLTRLLAGLLFGVQPRDPMVFIAVPVLLTAVALLACYLPARRATRINPLEALRWE
jgi:putative ABC transport system permease protein